MNARHLLHSLHQDFGFSLFPLTETKRPAVSWKRYQERQCSIDQLRQWEASHARFGIATGRLSGIVVVDLDGPEALEWATANLPPTPWVVLTGNKGGWRGQHWYYRYPPSGSEARNTVRVSVDGQTLSLDIRAEGGYVVAPGSIHESGVHYEATRPWDVWDDVPEFDPTWFPARSTPTPPTQPAAPAFAGDERFAKWLAAKPHPVPGTRNNETFSAACAGYDFGLTENSVAEHVWRWNQQSPDPLPYREVLACVRSAAKSKQPPQYPKGEIARKEQTHTRPSPSTPAPEQAAPERAYIERSYVWAVIGDPLGCRTLASFHAQRWQDSEASAAASALKALVERSEEPTEYALSQEMRRAGRFDAFTELLAFRDQYVRPTPTFAAEAYAAFREACNFDDLHSILTQELAAVGQGDFRAAASRAFDKLQALVAKSEAQKKPRTLKQAILDRLDEIESGEAESKKVRLRLLDKATGAFGPGDAIYLCGPPKTGKTGLLMQLLRDAAQDGHRCLLGQLELREEQVADREATYVLGKSLDQATEKERQWLRQTQALEGYDNILMTPQFTDLESYRAYVALTFAQYPDIELWATDYSEMVQSFSTKADPQAQTEAVSDFVKKTSTAFRKVGILLTQPKEEYFKDCITDNRPRLSHWKRGRKYQQDGQAILFLHRPQQFDSTMPAEYLELHLQLCRSAPPAMIPLLVEPETHIYRPWLGPLPTPGDPPQDKRPRGRAQQRSSGLSRMDLTVQTEDYDDNEIAEALRGW